jgi:DNA-binding beta-propeller fold protein YncE
MRARDANNATWYMLRYATDFAPRTPSPGDPAPPQFVPASAPALFYDVNRSVLELLPVKPAQALAPLPGFAVDLDGEIYLVDPANLQPLRRFCDGAEAPLLCEPGILRAPAGLALDRRGFLYATDPVLARVIVLRPEDTSAVAILAGDLVQPVDVAVAPDGRIYVADPAAGRIAVFDASFRPAGSFASQGATPPPAAPQPVAVMIGVDGSVLVADANHPGSSASTSTARRSATCLSRHCSNRSARGAFRSLIHLRCWLGSPHGSSRAPAGHRTPPTISA